MPAINTVFFDLFNTLLSVAAVPEDVGRFTADLLGLDRDEWNQVCFSGAHDICQPTEHYDVIRTLAHRLQPDIPPGIIEQATKERQARFDYALLNIEAEVLAVLTELKRRSYRLCLISNASTAEVSAWPRSPLADVFDAVIFSCECGLQKPDIAIFQHALDLMNTTPSRSLFVGDGGSDEFLGAHGAGMITVLTGQFSKPGHYNKVKSTLRDYIHYEIAHINEILVLSA